MSFGSLHAGLRPWAGWLYETADWYRLGPRVVSTYRSWGEQQRLYDRYRQGLSEYPAAPPGQSLHNYGLAFDLVTTVPGGLDRLGPMWERVGGRWGGRFGDAPHFDVGR